MNGSRAFFKIDMAGLDGALIWIMRERNYVLFRGTSADSSGHRYECPCPCAYTVWIYTMQHTYAT